MEKLKKHYRTFKYFIKYLITFKKIYLYEVEHYYSMEKFSNED